MFDVSKAGDLEKMLAARKIHYNESIKRDPYSFLRDLVASQVSSEYFLPVFACSFAI